VEPLWKPQPPGSDPQRSAESRRAGAFAGRAPQITHSRPRWLGLCKQEVAGSIPVGSTGGSPANQTHVREQQTAGIIARALYGRPAAGSSVCGAVVLRPQSSSLTLHRRGDPAVMGDGLGGQHPRLEERNGR
jgi:hypothetical protein